jgi:hypothetical protein
MVEFVAEVLEAFRRNGDADVYGCGLGCGLIAVEIGIKFSGVPAVDIELDASDVGGFRSGVFGEVETFLDKEMGLFDASLFPHLSEPGDALLPVEECFVMREVGVLVDESKEGLVGFCDEVAETFCEGAGEFRLR